MIGMWLSYSHKLSQVELDLDSSQAQIEQAQADLVAQQQAAGNLADLRIQTETANAERLRAEAEQASVEQRLAQSTSRLDELEDAVKSRGELLNKIQADLQATEEQLRNQQSELAKAETGIATQTQALTEIGERVEAARREEQEFRRGVADLSEEAARLAKEAAGAEERVQQAREAEASTQEALQAARLESSRIAEERTELESVIASLSTRRDAIATDISGAEMQRQAIQAQVTELASNLEKRSEELAQIEQRIEDQQSNSGGKTGVVDGTGILPGEYQAGPVQAYFSSDGTFRMTSAGGGRNVTGRYSVGEDVLTLDDAVGDTGTAVFPMRCKIEPQTDGFRLASDEASCSTLNGIQFKRSG
jgi:chromosome segregation ATPase